MEGLTDLLPLLEGGISIVNLFIWFHISNLKKDMEREKNYFLDFINQEKENNNDLDSRLRNIELELSRRWSTWGK